MLERFTGDARHVLVRAQEDARRFGHAYIRPGPSCATKASRPSAWRRKSCA
jgi:hypothetical protein